jgi:hypothetical protein
MTAMEMAAMLASLQITFGVVNKGKIEKNKSQWPSQQVFPVVFTSATTFLHTYKKFKKSRIIAFVTDNPFTLNREVGLPLLGAEIIGTRVVNVPFTIKELKNLLGRDVFLTDDLEFQRMTYTPSIEVMAKYAGSDLALLQTFLYRIKDVEKRNRVGKAIKTWLISTRPLKSLEQEIGRYVDDTMWVNICKIVNTKSVDTLRKAMQRVKGKPNDINRIAKDLKLSPFDIRYLLATK